MADIIDLQAYKEKRQDEEFTEKMDDLADNLIAEIEKKLSQPSLVAKGDLEGITLEDFSVAMVRDLIYILDREFEIDFFEHEACVNDFVHIGELIKSTVQRAKGFHHPQQPITDEVFQDMNISRQKYLSFMYEFET